MSGNDTRDSNCEKTPRSPSGPIGGGGSDGGDCGGNDPCAVAIEAPLNSPKKDVIDALAVGDILDVVLAAAGTRQVLEVRHNGELAGSLTFTGHIRIIECMEKGWKYRAVIVRKDGGFVTVRIEPA